MHCSCVIFVIQCISVSVLISPSSLYSALQSHTFCYAVHFSHIIFWLYSRFQSHSACYTVDVSLILFVILIACISVSCFLLYSGCKFHSLLGLYSGFQSHSVGYSLYSASNYNYDLHSSVLECTVDVLHDTMLA